MVAGTLQISGKRFVVVPEDEYDRLRQRAAAVGDVDMPELPAKLPSGNYPAVEAMRVGLARKLIKRRWAVGLSQAEVARQAGIRPETLNRIEKAKVTADTATVAKIARALDKAEHHEPSESTNLAAAIRARFAPLGGVKLPRTPRLASPTTLR